MHAFYISYLLRIWEVDKQDQQLFLASLEKPGSREIINFGDLDELFGFLKKQIQLENSEIIDGRNNVR